MKKIIFSLFLITTVISVAVAQDWVALKKNQWQNEGVPPTKGLGGNSISELIVQEFDDSTIVWAGTGSGLSRLNVDDDQWYTYSEPQGLGYGSLSALTIRDNEIWLATFYDSLFASAGSQYLGGGISFSKDGGQTWNHVKQPSETKIPGQNVTWDIALIDSTVWLASWSGGVRRSDDQGQTWNVVTPDGFILDPVTNLNHNAWAILNADGVLWMGTAGGVNKSVDKGNTWVNYTHQNQDKPISGNWARQLAHQKYDDKSVIWAACWIASSEDEDPTEYNAVCKSEDQGYTWECFLEGERAFGFAFDGPVVYVTAENGLFKSVDGGASWAHYPPIKDVENDLAVYTEEYYSAAVESNSTLWVGTTDGLARTSNDGLTWKIYRAFNPSGVNGEPRTYAFPNPFSPMRANNIDGDGHVRLQYNVKSAATVTIKIYDFALDHVVTVVNGKSRMPGDYHEVWDGKNERREQVANGVYHYSVEISGDGTYWGKIIVLD